MDGYLGIVTIDPKDSAIALHGDGLWKHASDCTAKSRLDKEGEWYRRAGYLLICRELATFAFKNIAGEMVAGCSCSPDCKFEHCRTGKGPCACKVNLKIKKPRLGKQLRQLLLRLPFFIIKTINICLSIESRESFLKNQDVICIYCASPTGGAFLLISVAITTGP